jgi:uncharacterized protein (DUF1330 family)
MQSRVMVVSTVTVRPDAYETFREFEKLAVGIMARYGGKVERVVVADRRAQGGKLKEVHLVSFPDEDRMFAYLSDEELASHIHMREASTLSTELIIGVESGDHPAVTTPA